MQIAAPIFLLILTRLRMPVSTTFLLLSCFASSAKGFFSLVVKSVSGYVIAILVGGGFWYAISPDVKLARASQCEHSHFQT